MKGKIQSKERKLVQRYNDIMCKRPESKIANSSLKADGTVDTVVLLIRAKEAEKKANNKR